jgi:hypothetical protein
VQGHGVLHLLTSPNGSLGHLAKMNPRLVCIRSRPQVLPQRSRMIICKSMESETTDGSEEVAKVESSSNGSSLAAPPPLPPPPSSSSPFTSGKISSRIAVKSVSNGETGRPSPKNSASLTDESKPPGPSSISTTPQKPAIRTTTEFKPSKSLLEKGNQGAFPTGRISPFAEDQLKSSVPPSSTSRASSRTMINSGKQVLEAFKRGEVEGKTTKFGQPIVPKNIFEDTRRTPEEIAADKFQFQLSTDALLLGLSFVLVIALMLATAFLVWKVGAIHYNE